MAKTPEKSEQKQGSENQSRWRPGQSGNPAGKPRGCKHKVTRLAAQLVDEQAAEIVESIIKRALSGDVACLRAVFDRILPPRRELPVKIDLPVISNVSDIPAAMATIISAASAGEITPGEASSMIGLLESMSRALATSDLEQRILALEAKMGGR